MQRGGAGGVGWEEKVAFFEVMSKCFSRQGGSRRVTELRVALKKTRKQGV